MSNTSVSNNKRIAKNTLLLYFRQILTMFVSLYTSRIVLNTLGIDDYGIYNVVGGVVTMFAFLNSTMASASQRFLAVDIAKGDKNKLIQTFNLTLLSYIILAIVAFMLCELLAVWFLNTQMNIPEERINAANWVLQCSIGMFIFNILTAPYMSVIIAREKMNVYAYASIAEAILKLTSVYCLMLIPYDKLKVYSVLTLFVILLISLFYALYCKLKFDECTYRLYFDRKRMREMFSFAGWNVLGSIANIARSQGINIVLNMFFSPAVNAARGIAFHVNSAIASFSNNFYTAVRPQIIKTYAVRQYDQMFNIIFFSSRLAFYLLFLISLPVLLLTDSILKFWLITPPDLSTLFVQLTILNSLIEILSFPLVNGLQACGKIQGYQIFISISYILVLPISYIFYKIGYPAETAMIVNIVIVSFCAIPRLLFCKRYIKLPIISYCKNVLVRVFIISVLGYVIGLCIVDIPISAGGIDILIKIVLLMLETSILIGLLGVTSQERTKVVMLLKSKIKHK